jgi:hypothetical protein
MGRSRGPGSWIGRTLRLAGGYDIPLDRSPSRTWRRRHRRCGSGSGSSCRNWSHGGSGGGSASRIGSPGSLCWPGRRSSRSTRRGSCSTAGTTTCDLSVVEGWRALEARLRQVLLSRKIETRAGGPEVVIHIATRKGILKQPTLGDVMWRSCLCGCEMLAGLSNSPTGFAG